MAKAEGSDERGACKGFLLETRTASAYAGVAMKDNAELSDNTGGCTKGTAIDAFIKALLFVGLSSAVCATHALAGAAEDEVKRPKSVAEAEAIPYKWYPPEPQKEGPTNSGAIWSRVALHVALSSSLDLNEERIGPYNAALIAAVRNSWISLLSLSGASRKAGGLVVLEFKLSSDGRVSDLKILKSTVGKLLSSVCEQAISLPAPFAHWSRDRQEAVGADSQIVSFTFRYLPDEMQNQ